MCENAATSFSFSQYMSLNVETVRAIVDTIHNVEVG